jgi:hypothetical protein
MPKFFDNLLLENRKKPDPEKNFFQNYSDHLDYLQLQFEKIWERVSRTKNVNRQLNIISDEALKRLSIFERLRDGHDYMDEIIGATALPAMGMVVSIASLAVGLWEGIQALATSIGLAKKHGEDHRENAINALLLSATSLVLSIACFLKSAVSLITRPVITAVKGFAKQDIPRFHNEESVEGLIAGM